MASNVPTLDGKFVFILADNIDGQREREREREKQRKARGMRLSSEEALSQKQWQPLFHYPPLVLVEFFINSVPEGGGCLTFESGGLTILALICCWSCYLESKKGGHSWDDGVTT